MRWGLRWQLVSPVALMLLGVAAMSATTAVVSARQARAQLEERLRTVGRFATGRSPCQAYDLRCRDVDSRSCPVAGK